MTHTPMSDMTPLTPEEEARLDRMRAALGEVSAPAGLRARIDAERAHTRPARTRRRLALGGGLATACAAIVVALVLVLPAGSGGPTVVEAATLTQLPATMPAPHSDPDHPGRLQESNGGLRYPYWEDRFHWRPAGAREDRLGGHRATTVYYEGHHGERLGYTIVDSGPLDLPPGARAVRRGATTFWVFRRADAPVVAWLRHGHQCVLSGDATIPAGQLIALAGSEY
jgi:hypothetical protein